uniref:(northern house mosquito) hypothetical protein n=1 Tax=Culex pipiens TaxID=7175 RepID=A0A8D8BM54_CULPI
MGFVSCNPGPGWIIEWWRLLQCLQWYFERQFRAKWSLRKQLLQSLLSVITLMRSETFMLLNAAQSMIECFCLSQAGHSGMVLGGVSTAAFELTRVWNGFLGAGLWLPDFDATCCGRLIWIVSRTRARLCRNSIIALKVDRSSFWPIDSSHALSEASSNLSSSSSIRIELICSIGSPSCFKVCVWHWKSSTIRCSASTESLGILGYFNSVRMCFFRRRFLSL